MEQNVGLLLETKAKQYGDKTFFIFEDKEISYKELDMLVNRMGNGLLSLGVKRGDRVGVYLPSRPDIGVAYFAIQKIGAVAVIINYMVIGKELSYIFNDAGITTVITDALGQENLEKISSELPDINNMIVKNGQKSLRVSPYEDLLKASSDKLSTVSCNPEDVAIIMYTSGTTGFPKGAMQSHKNLFFGAKGLKALAKIDEKDRALAVLPLFNNFGCTGLMFNTLLYGGTVVVLERFDPQMVLEYLEKYKITFMAGTPTMYIYINQAFESGKYKLPDFRLALTAGAAMAVENIEEFEDKFKTPLLNFYGMTETQAITGLHPESNPKPASIGMCLPDIKIRIVDENDNEVPRGHEGELVAISDSIVKGYWNKPDASNEAWKNGWFHTGDICMLDEEGHYYFIDRKKDIIITGGANIYPREVEDILYTNPKVSMAAVVGIPDKVKQELAKAYIVLKKGETATEREIIDYCREKIAKFKIPRMVEFVDSLPLGAIGKIDKKELKKRASSPQ